MSLMSEKFTDLLKDSGYRRSYSNLMKASAVLEHSKACCEFLKACHENDVLPNSCKVKICAKPSKSNLIEKLRRENIREASIRELELAVRAEELVTENAEEKLKSNLSKLSDKYSEEELEPMLTRLNGKKE